MPPFLSNIYSFAVPYKSFGFITQRLKRLFLQPHSTVPRQFSAQMLQETHSVSPAYKWQEGVEDLESYRQGGYHPTHIGDLYSDQRYRIVHKLGFGSYSTVWLARDLRRNTYVVLKIVVAEATMTSSEHVILQYLRQSQAGNPREGQAVITSLLDVFYIDGPNGRHLCLTTNPARCSIATSTRISRKHMFPLEVTRGICAQSILGVQAIHGSGIVHGGTNLNIQNPGGNPFILSCHISDLHLKNIFLALPDIHSLTEDELYTQFQPPQKAKVERSDDQPISSEAPQYSVIPARLAIASDKVRDPRICISDFGAAWSIDNVDGLLPGRPEDLRIPIIYSPPQAYFAKDQLGFPADIWTLACSIYEIMGERTLFEGFMPDQDDIIAEMISCLGGPLPHTWWRARKTRNEFFNEDGSWRKDTPRIHDSVSRPLLLRIQQNGRVNNEFSVSEIQALEDLLRAMLEYDTLKRATIKGVVESEWMAR